MRGRTSGSLIGRVARAVLGTVVLFVAAALGWAVATFLAPSAVDRIIDERADQPLVTDRLHAFEFDHIKFLEKDANDNPSRWIREAGAGAPETEGFRDLLAAAYAYDHFETPESVEAMAPERGLGRFQWEEYRVWYRVAETSVSWSARQYRVLVDSVPTVAKSEAVLFLPGAKADWGAMMGVGQSDFMNQLPARVLARADVWIVQPITDLRAAADANAKLTVVGGQLEGLRVGATCAVARLMTERYDRVFLYGIREGARTAEIVNALCEVSFARVTVDALPVPLELHLARRFLSLEVAEIGQLQTVGPFWGAHVWSDFPEAARNPTIYLLTATDLSSARSWMRQRARPATASDVVFAAKDNKHAGAEFSRFDRILDDGTLPGAVNFADLGRR